MKTNLYVIDGGEEWFTLVLTVVAHNDEEALRMAFDYCRATDDDASDIEDIGKLKIVETYELQSPPEPGVKHHWVHSG